MFWKLTCLVLWPNEAFTYLQAPQEFFGTFTNQEFLRTFWTKTMYKLYISIYMMSLELSRMLQTIPMPSTLVQRCVDISRLLQNLLHTSTSGCLQEVPKASYSLYKLKGGHLEQGVTHNLFKTKLLHQVAQPTKHALDSVQSLFLVCIPYVLLV